jgi:hypothetical protein
MLMFDRPPVSCSSALHPYHMLNLVLCCCCCCCSCRFVNSVTCLKTYFIQASDDALELVFDSGSQLEQISKEEIFDLYNSQLGNVNNATFDNRSPNKGWSYGRSTQCCIPDH